MVPERSKVMAAQFPPYRSRADGALYDAAPREERGERNLIVLDAGDVPDNASRRQRCKCRGKVKWVRLVVM
jgi:hypothetical protein